VSEDRHDEGRPLRLPVSPMGLAKALWRRRRAVLVGAVLAGLAGLLVTPAVVPVMWRSRAVLLRNEGGGGAVRLDAFQDLAHTEKTLVEFASRAGLQLSTDKLAALVQVEFEKRSGMVDVSVDSPSPDRAAALAVAYTDAFLAVTSQIQRAESMDRVAYYGRRLTVVDDELRRREDAIRTFKERHAIVDVSKQVKALLDQLGRFEALLQGERARGREVQLKLTSMDGIIADLAARARKEEEDAQATLRSRTTLRKQSERLHERITELRSDAAAKIRLANLEAELHRFEDLERQGVVARTAVEQRRMAYQEARARIDGNPQIRKLEAEVARLDEGILPNAPGSDGPSALILKEMVVEQMELRLEASTNESLVAYYEAAVQGVQKRLAELPALQAAHDRLLRDVTSLQEQLVDVRTRLDEARLAIDAGANPFVLLQRATVPSYPKTTRRRLLPLAAVAVGGAAGFLWALGGALRSLRLDDIDEVSSGLGLTAFGLVGRPTCHDPFVRGGITAALLESLGPLRPTANHGVVLAVTSLDDEEDRALVAETLCRGLERMGLRSFLVVADGFRPRSPDGLAWSGRPPGVTNRWVESDDFRTLLDETRRYYDVVVMTAPPLGPSVRGAAVATMADGVVLAIERGRHRTLALQRTLARPTAPLPTVVGAVVVEPPSTGDEATVELERFRTYLVEAPA